MCIKYHLANSPKLILFNYSNDKTNGALTSVLANFRVSGTTNQELLLLLWASAYSSQEFIEPLLAQSGTSLHHVYLRYIALANLGDEMRFRILFELEIKMLLHYTITLCVASVSFSSPKMLISHRGLFAMNGTLYLLGSSPQLPLISKTSFSVSWISSKFLTIRSGVTDLTKTPWPPTWAHDTMTCAGVAE